MKTQAVRSTFFAIMTMALSLGLLAGPAQAMTPVDLELSLLVDVSGSVDSTEFDLQKQGYANAFNNATVISAIENGTIGSVAVNMVFWSSSGNQEEVVPWTLITDATSAQNFANAVLAADRPFFGLTAPGSAINCVVAGGCTNDDDSAIVTFAANDFDGTRLVIDVSGDGEQNSGATTSDARDAAAVAGISINGLAIGDQDLVDWYTDNIITAEGFVVQAEDFDAFGDAVLTKIQTEIEPNPEPQPEPQPEPNPEPTTAVPEPGTLGLLAAGFGALQMRRMKKK